MLISSMDILKQTFFKIEDQLTYEENIDFKNYLKGFKDKSGDLLEDNLNDMIKCFGEPWVQKAFYETKELLFIRYNHYCSVNNIDLSKRFFNEVESQKEIKDMVQSNHGLSGT